MKRVIDLYGEDDNPRPNVIQKVTQSGINTIQSVINNVMQGETMRSEGRAGFMAQYPEMEDQIFQPPIKKAELNKNPFTVIKKTTPITAPTTTTTTTTSTTTTTTSSPFPYFNYAENQRRQEEEEPIQRPQKEGPIKITTILEPVLETAAQQFTKPDVNVLYRVMREVRWGGGFGSAIQYDQLSPEERTARGDTVITDVTATAFNSAIDISNMKHETNGKFHIITKAPKRLFVAETLKPSMELQISDNRFVFTTSMVTFKIQTIHNSAFATLGFGVNNFSHNMFQSSIDWIIPIAASLLETGALAGYDPALVRERFGQFTIWVNSSTGGLAEGTGVVFNRVTLGPFHIDSIIRARTERDATKSNFERFAGFIRVVEEAWRAAINANFINYSDDTDLDGLLLDTDRAKIIAANRRIESCILKFFPHQLKENPLIPINEASQVQPQIIDGVTQFVIQPEPIVLAGDAPFRPLSTLYKQEHAKVPLQPIASFTHIANSNLIAGVKGLEDNLFLRSTKGDKAITDGRLKHYIEQKLIKILQPASRQPGEEDAIPPQILPQEEPRRHINLDLGPDRLNEILYAKVPTVIAGGDMPALNPLDDNIEIMVINAEEERGHRYPEPIEQPRSPQISERTINIMNELNNIGAEQDSQNLFRYTGEDEVELGEKDVIYPWGEFGCLINKRDLLPVGIGREQIIWCPPQILDSDCFFRCLREALKELNATESLPLIEDDDHTMLKWRKHFNIEHNSHVTLDDLEQIAEQGNYRLNFYEILDTKCHDKTIQLLADATPESESALISHTVQLKRTIAPLLAEDDATITINLMSHMNHCYLIKKLQYVINKVKCVRCCSWIVKAGFSKHIAECSYCTQCRRNYKKKTDQQHECKKEDIQRKTPSDIRREMTAKLKTSVCEDWMTMRSESPGKKLKLKKKIWFADIETLPNADNNQYFEPYAIGLICMENLRSRNVVIFYGKSCMRNYLMYLSKYVTGNLYYYNGAAFDNYIHIHGMIKYGYALDPRAMIKMGSKIMTFSHNSFLKVYDLCLFIRAKLEKACPAWGVPTDMSKTAFNHDKVKNFADADKHREEVIEYLKSDVLALGALFEIYQKSMWECFAVDVATVMTPAQLAMKAWKTSCDNIAEFYIPHPGKEEDDDREAYYGGRVMCQRKLYDSPYLKEFEGCKQIPWNYQDIEDYLVIGDVNSLYPAVMHTNLYAYGKWKYQNMEELGEELHANMLTIINKSGSYSTGTHEFFIRRCFQVDVQCPKDLITAFLMERATDGSILHNLNDKIKKWYWGSELHEAIILGYRVTKVYQIKTYESSGEIFKSYIGKCWTERKKYAGGTPKNLCFKQAMNDLTGKFGQKTHLTNTVIYNTDHKPDHNAEKHWEADMARVVDFEMIFTTGGEEGDKAFNNAIILEIFAKDGGPSYPIAFSAQILAYARVHMSRIMRACDAYRNKERAIYYTDTDSLVMPSACIADLEAAGYIGKGLGQLKCDLNDSFFNNQFAKIVKGAWAATKGPYSMVYLLPDSCEPMEKIKVKGIPHPKEPVKYEDPVKFELDEKQEELLERIMKWLDKPHTYKIPGRVIGNQFYLFKTLPTDDTLKTESYYARNVNQEMIRLMMKQEGHCYAYYGNMKRVFNGDDGRVMMIRPNAVMRTLCKTNWWDKNKRIYLDNHTEDGDLSYPVGYSCNSTNTQ